MSGKNVYLATSWKNPYYELIRAEMFFRGYKVYDFKDPEAKFTWDALGEGNEQLWTADQFVRVLKTQPECFRGFKRDADALKWCDVCVLLLPCGNSAHIEAGWAAGAGKKLIIYIHPGHEFKPELMYKYAEDIVTSDEQLWNALRRATT